MINQAPSPWSGSAAPGRGMDTPAGGLKNLDPEPLSTTQVVTGWRAALGTAAHRRKPGGWIPRKGISQGRQPPGQTSGVAFGGDRCREPQQRNVCGYRLMEARTRVVHFELGTPGSTQPLAGPLWHCQPARGLTCERLRAVEGYMDDGWSKGGGHRRYYGTCEACPTEDVEVAIDRRDDEIARLRRELDEARQQLRVLRERAGTSSNRIVG